MVFVRDLEPGEDAPPENLAFRRRLRALYGAYADVQAFELALYQALNTFIVERISRDAESSEVAALEPSEAAPPEPAAEDAGAPGVSQSRAALDAVSSVLAGESDEVAHLDLVRAHLATAAELSGRITRATLDVHDLMAAYRLRGRIEATAGEQLLIDRTLAQTGYAAAGWGLTGAENWEPRLARLVLTEPDADIRAGVMRELGLSGALAMADWLVESADRSTPLEVFSRLMDDDDERVRESAARVVGDAHVDGAEEVLRGLFERTGSITVFKTLLQLLLETDVDAAVQLAFENPAWIDDYEEQILGLAPEVSDSAVREAFDGRPAVKRLALLMLAARGELSRDEAEESLQADHRPLRLAALKTLIEMGMEFEEEQIKELVKTSDGRQSLFDEHGPAVERAWLQRRTTAELREGSDWGAIGLSGSDALTVLLGRDEDEETLTLVRHALANGFEDLRRAGFEAAVERFGGSDEVRVWLTESFGEHQDLYDTVWRAAALRGLSARGGSEEDAELARRYIEDDDIQTRAAAAELLSLVPSEDDMPALVRYAADNHGSSAADALAAAAGVVGRGEDLLAALGEGEAPRGIVAGMLREIYARELPVELDTLRPMLHSRDSSTRRHALAIAVRGLDTDQLAELLESYSDADETRYYDVIGVLDRLIYAPSEVAEAAESWIQPTTD